MRTAAVLASAYHDKKLRRGPAVSIAVGVGGGVLMAIQATPSGTHGARVPGISAVRKLFALYVRAHVRSYRRSGGTDRMTRRWDFPVVLLTTKGAKSGLERITALGGFPDGEDAWLVVASMAGWAHHPAWFFNMLRNPDDLWLEVGKRKVKVRGRSLLGAERTAALQRIAAISPRYGKYQEQTDREIPIVRLTAVPGSASRNDG